jgi:hypothetical protein
MRAWAAALILVMSCSQSLCDPVGVYEMTGTNPGNGAKYSGRVALVRTGHTFQVTWTVSGHHIAGIGIGKSDYLAVSFGSASTVGIAVYKENQDGWIGIWALAGGREVGAETWKRISRGP